MTEHSHTEQGDSVIVGYVEPRPMPVTVRREPDPGYWHFISANARAASSSAIRAAAEVGIAWEATCAELGLAALGRTPGEAAANLGDALKKRGLVHVLDVDPASVDRLVTGDKRS